jgi:hypothetical protein
MSTSCFKCSETTPPPSLSLSLSSSPGDGPFLVHPHCLRCFQCARALGSVSEVAATVDGEGPASIRFFCSAHRPSSAIVATVTLASLGTLRRPRGPGRAPGAVTERRDRAQAADAGAEESGEPTAATVVVGGGTAIDTSPEPALEAFFCACGISSGASRRYATRAAARGITLESAIARVRTKEQLTTELGMLKGHVVLVLGGLKQRRKEERDRAKAREREERRLRKGESSRRRVALPTLRRKKSSRAPGEVKKSKSRRLLGRKGSSLRPVKEEPKTPEAARRRPSTGSGSAKGATPAATGAPGGGGDGGGGDDDDDDDDDGSSSSSSSSHSDDDGLGSADPDTLVSDDYTPNAGVMYIDSSLRTALSPAPDAETARVVADDGVALDDPTAEYLASPPSSLRPLPASAASTLLASRWTSPPDAPPPPPLAFIVILSCPASLRVHSLLPLRGATARFITTPKEIWGHVIVTKTVVHFVPEREKEAAGGGGGFMSVPLAALAGVEEFGERSALLRLAEPAGELVRFSALPSESTRDDLVEVVATLLVQSRQAAELAAYKLSAIRAELACAREEAEHAKQVAEERERERERWGRRRGRGRERGR